MAEPETITIDNYSEKMAELGLWSSESEQAILCALVDMGSNGIRFSITEVGRLVRCVYRERAPISLYDALNHSAHPLHFPSSTIAQVAETMARFKSTADSYGVSMQRRMAFATEAMRTARNREEMLGAIEKASGWKVVLLQGAVESLYGATGARSGFDEVEGLFMDLGGGSVQMTYMDSKVPQYPLQAAKAAISIPWGAAKLTQKMQHTSRGSTSDILKEISDDMKPAFANLQQKFPALKSPETRSEGVKIYFCGGGFRGYGSMLMHTDPIQPYPIPNIGGYSVPGERFVQWEKMLAANGEDGKIFGLSKRRREQFPAICMVVRSLISTVPKIEEVIFCSGGNREGAIFTMLPSQHQEYDPVLFFPGGADDVHTAVFTAITSTISDALGRACNISYLHRLLSHVARNLYTDTGMSEDVNSAKGLHEPISGRLAGLPGFTHEQRAVFALTMCARWGQDLGPADTLLHDNLQRLVGPRISFWCDYVGALAKTIATVIPAFPINAEAVKNSVGFQGRLASDLGKKGKKEGIALEIQIGNAAIKGLDTSRLADGFKHVGKGFEDDWRVEATVVPF